MYLSSFQYKENKWELSNLSFNGSLCLLVGRNSTGKTRTIRALQNVVSFMQMKQILLGNSRSFSAKLVFDNVTENNLRMEYSFTVKEGLIDREFFSYDDRVLIKRTLKDAKYDSKSINPPADKLIVQVRRDKELYPEIELLMEWAEGVTWVSCSDINPYTIIGPAKFINPYAFSELVDSLDDTSKKNVLKKAKQLDFDLISLNTVKHSDSLKLVVVKERFVKDIILDMNLSNGMQRILYLLCFIEQVKNNSKERLLLIDDMSEGLDYSRSTRLGKMIFEDCTNSGLQVIASSNDAFLMDVVSLSKWQILRRKGSKVSAINQSTYPELFRKFEMTGLNNFDLFSSDFIDKFLTPKE